MPGQYPLKRVGLASLLTHWSAGCCGACGGGSAREPLPARKALPCAARPAVRACLRPRRTLLSDDSRLARCGADSSALAAPGQRRGSGGGCCHLARARRAGPGHAGCPRSPGARGGQAWPGASGAQVCRLSPCGPGPASCPRPCGEAAEGCRPGGAGDGWRGALAGLGPRAPRC